MSGEPKHRLVVRSEGTLREIASVHERANGDLVISFKLAEAEKSLDEYVGLTHWKMSVHRGDRTPTARTFKSERVFATGERVTNPALITCERRPLLAPVMSTRHSWLNERQDLSARPADTVHQVAELDPANWTLTTHLFVSDRATFNPADMYSWLPVKTISFRLFDLHIGIAFSPIPSIDWADTLELLTSRSLDPTAPPDKKEPLYAMKPVELRMHLDLIHWAFHRRLVARIDHQLRNDPDGPFDPKAFLHLCERAMFYFPQALPEEVARKIARAMTIQCKLSGSFRTGLHVRASAAGSVICDTPALKLLAGADRDDFMGEALHGPAFGRGRL